MQEQACGRSRTGVSVSGEPLTDRFRSASLNCLILGEANTPSIGKGW